MGLVFELTSTPAKEKPVEPHFNPQLNARELRFAKEFASTHGGLLPGDAFWTYIRFRYDLDPSRFDHYHPRIYGMVAHDALVRWEIAHPTPPNPPPIVVPPTPPVPPVSPPVSSSVPEPSAAILLASALVAFVVFRWVRALTGSARDATTGVFRKLVRG